MFLSSFRKINVLIRIRITIINSYVRLENSKLCVTVTVTEISKLKYAIIGDFTLLKIPIITICYVPYSDAVIGDVVLISITSCHAIYAMHIKRLQL